MKLSLKEKDSLSFILNEFIGTHENDTDNIYKKDIETAIKVLKELKLI